MPRITLSEPDRCFEHFKSASRHLGAFPFGYSLGLPDLIATAHGNLLC